MAPLAFAFYFVLTKKTTIKDYSLEEIKSDYNKGKKDLALKKLKESGDKLLSTSIGCDIVVSIYAETRKWNRCW